MRYRPNILRDGQKIVMDRVSRAYLMNSFFHSVFTPRSNNTTGTQHPFSCQPLSDVILSVSEVHEVLIKLDPTKNPTKASGPGDILVHTRHKRLYFVFYRSIIAQFSSLVGNGHFNFFFILN